MMSATLENVMTTALVSCANLRKLTTPVSTDTGRHIDRPPLLYKCKLPPVSFTICAEGAFAWKQSRDILLVITLTAEIFCCRQALQQA